MGKKENCSMSIKTILFDMDGTIVDVPYDWKRIKQDLKTGGKPILPFISSLLEPVRSEKWRILEMYEDAATAKAVLKKGIKEFLNYLKEKNIRTALITNNSKKNVSLLLNKFGLDFDLVMSRESGLWKPSGEPFLYALDRLGFKTHECCVIGDSHFDILAALDAGIKKIFILSDNPTGFAETSVEWVCTIAELQQKIQPLLF